MALKKVAKFLVCRSCDSKSLVSDSISISCPQCLLKYNCVGGKVFVDEPKGINFGKLPKSIKTNTQDKNSLRAKSRSYIRSVLRTSEYESVLDIGTGRGHYINEIGLDKEVLTLDYLPYEDVLVVANIEAGLPIRESSFDAVMLSHTLEHIFDTKALLSDCFKVLKPGGFLVGAVPFLTKVHQAPHDFYRLTDFALTRYFEELGFTSIKVSPLNSVFETISLHLNSSYKFLSKDLNLFQRGLLKILTRSWQKVVQNMEHGETRSDFTLGYGFSCKKP